MPVPTRAAVEEGVVPGGGVALLRAIKSLEGLNVENGDQKVDVNIVKKALGHRAGILSIRLALIRGAREERTTSAFR